eukprot:gnl/TRDRNA2_/TRDRNA2_185436_c0_seq1.p1 gnl/TRDRNA2_/TRDRNA2_185436_c0~~gnl/TRDRNA2_/TRDRNA2_185436_c0_seq1.p1  ORF type:complete len:408 (+),score=125.24 gnl/TRDRNA2_/TRDRNA2_185436_c0_seq1:88-1224(+)
MAAEAASLPRRGAPDYHEALRDHVAMLQRKVLDERISQERAALRVRKAHETAELLRTRCEQLQAELDTGREELMARRAQQEQSVDLEVAARLKEVRERRMQIETLTKDLADAKARADEEVAAGLKKAQLEAAAQTRDMDEGWRLEREHLVSEAQRLKQEIEQANILIASCALEVPRQLHRSANTQLFAAIERAGRQALQDQRQEEAKTQLEAKAAARRGLHLEREKRLQEIEAEAAEAKQAAAEARKRDAEEMEADVERLKARVKKYQRRAERAEEEAKQHQAALRNEQKASLLAQVRSQRDEEESRRKSEIVSDVRSALTKSADAGRVLLPMLSCPQLSQAEFPMVGAKAELEHEISRLNAGLASMKFKSNPRAMLV